MNRLTSRCSDCEERRQPMTREEETKILEKQFDKYQNKDKLDYENDLTLLQEILKNTKYLKKNIHDLRSKKFQM